MSFKNVWKDKKYHPHFCEKLIEHFVTGGTVAQFCYSIDMGSSNFYKWLDKYPEFKASYEKAQTFKRAFHESELKKNLENPNINPNVYKHYMRMVVGEDDKSDTPNVTVNNVQTDPEIVAQIKAFKEKFKSEY